MTRNSFMTSKALSATVAAIAVAAASSVYAVSNGAATLSPSIDPYTPSAEYRVALIEVDHKLDREAMHQLGEQMSQSKDTTLETVAKAIAGNGSFTVLRKPASISVVEGELFPMEDLNGIEVTMPVKFENGTDSVRSYAEVGYRLDVDAIQIDTTHGKAETVMQIKHSALANAGNVASMVLREKDTMAAGDVHIMSWSLAGKQYAMAIQAERFKVN
jgi:hypothetical protein